MEQCADTTRVSTTPCACVSPSVIFLPARPRSSVTPFGDGYSLPRSNLTRIIRDRDRNCVPGRLIYRIQMHL